MVLPSCKHGLVNHCFEHEDVSPMVKQMQVLERRLIELEQTFRNGYSDHDEHIHDLENIQAEKRLLALEKRIAELEQDLQDISFNHIGRINNLVQHKNYQIDENRKESRQLDMLCDAIHSVEKDYMNQHAAIEDLAKKVDDLQERVQEILECSVSVPEVKYVDFQKLCDAYENFVHHIYINNMSYDRQEMDELRNAIADLSIKINQQHSSLREFEKQRIKPKFDEINSAIDSLIRTENFLVERIEKLEKLLDVEKMEKLFFDSLNLYKETSILAEKLQSADLSYNRPHKCPVCEGKTFHWPENCVQQNCHACEGKGIVWG